MMVRKIVYCAALIVGIYAFSHLHGQPSFINASTALNQQLPTKEEFDKLQKLVTDLVEREQKDIASINALDNTINKNTKDLTKRLDDSEFKFEGIGDVIASALTLDQFRRAHNDSTGNRWVVCDGTPYPGSAYAQIAGREDVPDLKGRYPRGFTDGLTLLGKLDDRVKDHSHRLKDPDAQDSDANPRGVGIQPDAKGEGNNHVLRYGYDGKVETKGITEERVRGDETRPKTTVVNFFIRIN